MQEAAKPGRDVFESSAQRKKGEIVNGSDVYVLQIAFHNLDCVVMIVLRAD